MEDGEKMYLIRKFKQFSRRELLDSSLKSLQEFCLFYKIEISSYEIFLLSELYCFFYTNIDIPQTNLIAIPYIGVRHNHLEQFVLEKMALPYQKVNYGDSQEALENLKSLVNEDKPVLFKFHTLFMLNDDKLSLAQETMFYCLSTLLLVGYDEDKKEVLVILVNDDEQQTPLRMSYFDFQTFRNLPCTPYSPAGTCYYLDNENEFKYHLDLKTLILQSLQKTVDEMLHTKYVNDFDFGNLGTWTVAVGIHGMQLFSEAICELISLSSSSVIEENYVKLVSSFLRNNLFFGTTSCYRFEFAKSLKYVSKKYNLIELSIIADDYNNIIKNWKKILSLLKVISISKQGTYFKLQQLKSIFNKTLDLEEAALERLEIVLNKLI